MRRINQLATAVIVGSLLLGVSSELTLAQDSTVPEVDFSPNPEQCNQAPRTVEEIETLLASATPESASDMVAPGGFELPAGEEAPPEVRGGIVETIVQILACANGGDTLASLGGVTDALLTSQIATGIIGADLVSPLSGTPVPLPEESQIQLLDTREFTLYDDGRAGVLVYFRSPSGQTAGDEPVQIGLWIFEQEDGRWLLDEMVIGLESQLGDMATPPAG